MDSAGLNPQRTAKGNGSMLLGYWIARLLRDISLFSIVNRAYVLGSLILVLLFFGLLILGAEVSAPFIYTLF